ncbi:MAG: hypothetical protein Q9198_011065, partial [Flavoplaca austrocitrina]
MPVWNARPSGGPAGERTDRSDAQITGNLPREDHDYYRNLGDDRRHNYHDTYSGWQQEPYA